MQFALSLQVPHSMGYLFESAPLSLLEWRLAKITMLAAMSTE